MDKLNSCNKSSFARVFCGEDIHLQHLQKYITQCHYLSFHASHVLKLHALRQEAYDVAFTKKLVEQTLYLLNDDFRPRNVQDATTTDQMKDVVQAYREHVPSCVPIGMRNVQQTIHYLATSLYTNMTVNVQCHFTKMLLKYINLRLDTRGQMSRLKAEIPANGREPLLSFYLRLRTLRDIFTLAPGCDGLLSEIELSEEEEILRCEVQSILPYDKPQSESLAYTVVCKPERFISAYCRISSYMEAYGYPQFSALPLRRSHIASHAPIDTKILCTQILRDSSLVKTMTDNKHTLWSRVFKLHDKAFKPRSGLHFSGMIKTDGTAVSVHLENGTGRYGRKRKRVSKASMEALVKDSYFENHLREIDNCSNFVVIDPNKRDLLYCQDANGERVTRYTSNQRAVETRSRKYRRLRERLKRDAGISVLESTIPTHKTMDLSRFVAYLSSLDANSETLRTFYTNTIHNKLSLNSYINTKRSEDSFVNHLKAKYNRDISVIMGDWNDAGRTMRFQTSSKTKGWQKVFQRNHVPFYHLDEHKTSKYCPTCECETYKPFRRLSSRPWRASRGQIDRVNGLLGCTNLECMKQDKLVRYWNRDSLSTLNMLKIIRGTMETGRRPSLYCRSSFS